MPMPMPSCARPLLAILAVGCNASAPPEPTTAGLVIDTIASPANLPSQGLAGGAVLPDGRLALADVIAGTVWLVGPDGGAPGQLVLGATAAGRPVQPIGVTAMGDTIAVIEAGNSRVELFASSGAPLGTLELAPELLAGPFELLPTGEALLATYGQDSALATRRSRDGVRLARYGSSTGTPDQGLDPAAIKRAIREGEIPEVFRNVVLPVGAPNGDIWLALHTEGVLQRHAADGRVLATATLPPEELAPLREEFFRANTDPEQPGAVFAYLMAYSGAADDAGAWFLLAQPADRTAVLVRIANDGSLGERLAVAEAPGARLLLRDAARDIFYLVNQQAGVVIRARRSGPE